MSGRPHPPSQMRALLQEWKRGLPLRDLLEAARAIADPSFAAEALFALATDDRLPDGEAERVALEALRSLDRSPRDWRRGEALAGMGRRLPEMRRRHPAAAARAAEAVVERAAALAGPSRGEALRALAPCLDADGLPGLMAAALAREGAAEAGKAVLRAAAEAGAAGPVLAPIRACADKEVRLRLLGAWASRMAATQPEEAGRVLAEALHGLMGEEKEVRLDVARAVAAGAEGMEPLHALHRWAAGLGDEEGARVLAAVGGRADRLGARALGEAWLREAEARAARIADAKARAGVLRNVQEGLRRMGVAGPDATAPPRAPPRAEAPPPRPPEEADAAHPLPPPRAAPGGRHVLALVDAYEGGLSDVHLRAVARAAPLCDAFGLDLALVGFPVKDLAAFVKRAGRETNVGEGRGSLELLHREGRLHLVAVPEAGAPDLSGLGDAVATTPHPDPAKAATDFPAGRRLCVLVGLGPKGLPEAMLRACAVHVELTGRRVSLETATAMGVVAERLGKATPPER